MGRLAFLLACLLPGLALASEPRGPAYDAVPMSLGGVATGDFDLDSGNFQLILDDGATGAGNGAIYFGQDTDLNLYRSAANTLTLEGKLIVTSDITSNTNVWLGAGYDLIWNNRSTVNSPVNSHLRFTNYDETAFGLLQLGPYEQAADTAVAGSTIKTTNAYSQAETNTTGGPLYLGGGVGTKEIKIVQASASGSTLTFVVDGTSTTITADTEWNCTTNDATCCAELETYLDANIAGFTATCDTVDEVYLDPATTTRAIELISADGTGTKFVVVNGIGGLILFTGGHSTASPAWAFASDPDLAVYRISADRMGFIAGGNRRWDYSSTAINLASGIDIHLTAAYIVDDSQDLAFGGPCDAAGTTGNVCVGGAKLTVDEALQVDGTATFALPPVFADYTRHHDVPIGAAIVGAAAPAVETIGTFRCYVFDANADLAHISVEVPSEWNGTSDMAIDVLIFTDQGDALGSGEVIEFDLVYRSVDEGEAYDNGTAVTILANVTGGGAEVDKGQYKITATVDYDDTDQPLAVNDTLGFSIMRDVTTGDTYSGDVHVCRAQLVYTANALATH